MFAKIEQLRAALEQYFDKAVINDSSVLNEPNGLMLIIGPILRSPLTFHRYDYVYSVRIIYSLEGTGIDVYNAADVITNNIEVEIDNLFEGYEITKFDFQYKEEMARLFCAIDLQLKETN
jgi:hypothetical protein